MRTPVCYYMQQRQPVFIQRCIPPGTPNYRTANVTEMQILTVKMKIATSSVPRTLIVVRYSTADINLKI